MCDHCTCRDFAPIADLSAEHEVILELAWAVAEDPDLHGEGRLARRDALLAILDGHNRKEELGLYPRLLESGDLSARASERLEEEHRVLHVALVGATFDRRDYYALAAHIEEEEMELFSAAMLAFDDDVWHDLEHVQRDVGTAVPV